MHIKTKILQLLALVLLLFACGESADTSPQDLETLSVTLIAHSPETPTVGSPNQASILITKDGDGVEDLTVQATPWMPAHGHGSSTTPTAAQEEQGRYLIDNIIYTMPGSWELRLKISGVDVEENATLMVEVP